jgi:large subunit ribosomal protein L30
MADSKKLNVTLVKGVGSTREDHRATVRGLGLKRIRQTVELEDTKAVRGMINKVSYLVSVAGE